MERINLIPDDVKIPLTERLFMMVGRRFVPILIGSVGTLILIEGGVAIQQHLLTMRDTKRASAFTEKRATLVADVENAKAYVKQTEQSAQELQTQLDGIMQRIAYLTTYQQGPGDLAQVLKDVKLSLPYGVWLTLLQANPKGHLRIMGGALDDRLVSQLMGQLKANHRFLNVAFNYAKQSKIGKQGIVEFEVTCDVVRGGGVSS